MPDSPPEFAPLPPQLLKLTLGLLLAVSAQSEAFGQSFDPNLSTNYNAANYYPPAPVAAYNTQPTYYAPAQNGSAWTPAPRYAATPAPGPAPSVPYANYPSYPGTQVPLSWGAPNYGSAQYAPQVSPRVMQGQVQSTTSTKQSATVKHGVGSFAKGLFGSMASGFMCSVTNQGSLCEGMMSGDCNTKPASSPAYNAGQKQNLYGH